jgi:hypothetical protein
MGRNVGIFPLINLFGSLDMALLDWIWLVKLVMEILRLISQLPDEELKAMCRLRIMDESEVT